MRALYKLSRDLSETPDVGEMLETAVRELGEFYKLPVLALTPDSRGDLVISAGDSELFGWNDNERSVARWVFDKAQIAGAGSDTLAGAAGMYLPLKGMRGAVGVLGIRPGETKTLQDPEQIQLLETFASEIGGALDSTRMSEAIGRAEMQVELHAMAPSPSNGVFRISDALNEKRVLIFESGLSKEQMIRGLLSRLEVPNPTQAFQAILEREKAGATLIGPGVTIPHARISGLKGIQAALGISHEGPVHVWLLFVAPSENPKLALMFLAGLATFFQNETHANVLAQMKSVPDILSYIRKSEAAT